MLSAQEALERLQKGNQRFAAGAPTRGGGLTPAERAAMTSGQQPFAAVLGCADSRVPAEIVFDQGIGDLFVVRVAGNVVAPSQLGSIEFATTGFGARLVVVLGHSGCGAVTAALEEIRQPTAGLSPNLAAITDRVGSALSELVQGDQPDDPGELHRLLVRANIERSVRQLLHGSEILQGLVGDGLMVVGAEYSLATGEVKFFE